MMRTLVLISVCLFGFSSRASAQNVDFSFPSDVFGFRFGDSRASALRNCLNGESYNENVFICHRPAHSLGFDADLYVVFNSDNHIERVWIQSNPESNQSQVHSNYSILLNDLINRFGTADYITDENEYHWIFDQLHEEGEITVGFYMINNSQGFFQINFNANP